jgi:hypothetical protein
MARGFSYIITRDFGFAPNPFHGVLTLATCKPRIRKAAHIGDYLIGNSNKNTGNKLIYMAKVDEILTFDEYWNDIRFMCKKPTMNGSYKTLYGDNIYHKENGEWIQANSHHSLENGLVNHANLDKDTGTTDHLLICREFFYLGASMIDVADLFPNCIHRIIGHHQVEEDDCKALWRYLEERYPEKGLIDVPNLFRSFIRYNGK